MADNNEASITLDTREPGHSAGAGDTSSNAVAHIDGGRRGVDAQRASHGLSGEGGALISMIERASRDPSVDIDKFERLLKMQQLVASQANERAFNAAISAVKGKIGPIAKKKTVDFTTQKGRTTYKHEDLAEVSRTVDQVLSEHGLSYRYSAAQEGGKLVVSCILTHVGGHSETTTLAAPNDQSGNKNDIQAIGSAATYLQRYTLKLALGLAASVDDDGKAAGATIEAADDREAKIARVKALIKETKADEKWICTHHSIETIDDLSGSDLEQAIKGLEARKRKPANG